MCEFCTTFCMCILYEFDYSSMPEIPASGTSPTCFSSPELKVSNADLTRFQSPVMLPYYPSRRHRVEEMAERGVADWLALMPVFYRQLTKCWGGDLSWKQEGIWVGNIFQWKLTQNTLIFIEDDDLKTSSANKDISYMQLCDCACRWPSTVLVLGHLQSRWWQYSGVIYTRPVFEGPSVMLYLRSFWVRLPTLIAMFLWLTWGPSGADRTQVGSMLVPGTLLSGKILDRYSDTITYAFTHLKNIPNKTQRYIILSQNNHSLTSCDVIYIYVCIHAKHMYLYVYVCIVHRVQYLPFLCFSQYIHFSNSCTNKSKS